MASIWSTSKPFYSIHSGVDPAIDWALGPGRRYFFVPGEEEWLPLVLELNNIAAKDLASGAFISSNDEKDDWVKGIQIPHFYINPPKGLAKINFCTAMVKERLLMKLIDKKLAKRMELGLPLRAASLPKVPPTPRTKQRSSGRSKAGPSPLKTRGAHRVSKAAALPHEAQRKSLKNPTKVIVGVIDDGIAFINERFRIGEEPRAEYWWHQDGIYTGVGTGPLDYGHKLDKAAIKVILGRCKDAAGTVDEEKFYLLAGLVDHARPDHKAAAWRAAHGTHVMDTAAGYDNGKDNEGNPVDRPIVAVQLPTATTADTSGASRSPPLSKYVIDAIVYILDCADAMAGQGNPPIPVVINLSYGVISGLYYSDYNVTLETKIDEIVGGRNKHGQDQGLRQNALEIVLPAGNSHLSRCHAQVSFTKREADCPPASRQECEVSLNWRILPDDRTPSFLDISLPMRVGGNTDRVTLTVTPPGGSEILPPIGEDPSTIYRSGGCEVQYLAQNIGERRSARFKITLLPTADHEPANPVAASGIWIIKLTNKEFVAGHEPIDAVIQRDDTPYGYPQRGRQSYFDHPDYVRFDHAGREIEEDDPNCIVRRSGLLNAIARGDKSVVLGGYVRKEDVAASYSAGGPTRNANRRSPDAMSASEDSKVHRGILAAGTRSGSVVAMGGTSIAAPRATRRMAKWMTEGRTADRQFVMDKAADSETANRRPPPPLERLGGGRIKLDQVVDIQRFEADTAKNANPPQPGPSSRAKASGA